MSKTFPMIPLGELLIKSEERAEIDPGKRYRQVTVRLWGKGVILREEVAGIDIAASKQFIVKANQFILSKIDARNGAFGLVPDSLDGALVSSDFPVFTPNYSRIVPEFLHWMSKTRDFVNLCSVASEGTTNRVRLKEDRFLATRIPLPPLEEQQRIVARIEELMAKIGEAQGLHNQMDSPESIYVSIVASIIESRRNAWQKCKVSDVILSIDSGWSPQCLDQPVTGDQWGVLKTTSVQWGEFRSNENKAIPGFLIPRSELCVRSGDVLVTRAGPRKRVGVVAAVRDDAPHLMISDKLIRIRPDHSKITPRFLELSLSSPLSQEYLIQRKTGLADAQVNISQNIIKATPIAYPSLTEQQSIITYLDEFQSRIGALKGVQAKISAELDAILPSILDKAFKGEL